eukprot:417908-Hanusia_phi.AAC.1
MSFSHTRIHSSTFRYHRLLQSAVQARIIASFEAGQAGQMSNFPLSLLDPAEMAAEIGSVSERRPQDVGPADGETHGGKQASSASRPPLTLLAESAAAAGEILRDPTAACWGEGRGSLCWGIGWSQPSRSIARLMSLPSSLAQSRQTGKVEVACWWRVAADCFGRHEFVSICISQRLRFASLQQVKTWLKKFEFSQGRGSGEVCNDHAGASHNGGAVQVVAGMGRKCLGGFDSAG